MDILNEFKNAEYNVTFVGDGALTYKDLIISTLGNKCLFIESNDLSAYKLGLAGLNHFNSNDIPNVQPLYLRKPQAELVLEKKLQNNN